MPTTKTSKLTAEQALEILQEAVLRCQQCGIQVGVSNLYSASTMRVAIMLNDVRISHDGNLVLAKSGNEP